MSNTVCYQLVMTYMFVGECKALSECHASIPEDVLLDHLINLSLVEALLVARNYVIRHLLFIAIFDTIN